MSRRLPALVGVLLLAGCGGDSGPYSAADNGGVRFGADDTTCTSVVLENEADDAERLRPAADCFVGAVAAGESLVWDVRLLTVEGDPVFVRFDATGDAVVIVEDDRLDSYGAGGVRAERCASVAASSLLPEGTGCEPEDHPGFVDADG